MFSVARTHIILMGLLLLMQGVHAQPSKAYTDSLQHLLSETDDIHEKTTVALELSYQIYRSNPLKALEYAREAEQLAKQIKSDSLLNQSYLNQADIYIHLGNYPKALLLCQDVIHGNRIVSNSYLLAIANANMGVIYYYQHDFESALTYYLKALDHFKVIANKANRKQLIRNANLLNNIGIIYDESHKFKESAYYYDEARSLATKINDPQILANAINNQGTLYRDQGDNEKAFLFYQEAMEIRKKNNNKLGMARSYHNLGQFYKDRLKNIDSAEQYFRKAIVIGKEIGSWQTVSSSSGFLYELYKQQGKYKDAFETLELNQRATDSLFNEESTRKIAEMEMQFDFDRKQSLLAAQQKERELYYWMGGGGLVLLLIIVTLLFFLQRSKTRRSQLEQTNLELEKTKLKNDLAIKDKELAANIMYLLNKNELINTISEKLLEIKQNVATESQQSIQKLVLDLQSNLQPELWQEFEFRFQQVHEQFYKSLNEKFPDLSPSERRLCAFLKLNMSTKEISAITHQNAKSIDVARTRLRKKLNLTGTDANLLTFLAQIDTTQSQS